MDGMNVVKPRHRQCPLIVAFPSSTSFAGVNWKKKEKRKSYTSEIEILIEIGLCVIVTFTFVFSLDCSHGGHDSGSINEDHTFRYGR